LGLKENWRQFSLLVLVNAFVGGMVGLERTVVPLIGSQEFGLVFRTAIFSFPVRDTEEHVRLEEESHPPEPSPLGFRELFLRTSLNDRNLFARSQAGLVNNLNDGMSWGAFPLFFASFGLGVGRIGILKAVYPAVWGVLQVATGPLATGGGARASSSAACGCRRARSLSVYRFWRDLGHHGALSAGVVADLFGLSWAIGSVGALTFASGAVVAGFFREKEGRVAKES
jgi:hypothetical protein